MSTVFDEVNIRGLRVAHFNQLLNYLEAREDEGWYYGKYYGNREQFEKRHIELKNWLVGIISYANSDGVVIPKSGRRNKNEKDT